MEEIQDIDLINNGSHKVSEDEYSKTKHNYTDYAVINDKFWVK